MYEEVRSKGELGRGAGIIPLRPGLGGSGASLAGTRRFGHIIPLSNAGCGDENRRLLKADNHLQRPQTGSLYAASMHVTRQVTYGGHLFTLQTEE